MEGNAEKKAVNQSGVKFGLARIYTKDISLEAPSVTELVTGQLKVDEGSLTLEPNLNFKFKELQGGLFELVARLKLTAKSGSNLLYLLEVQQAAIFSISGQDVKGEQAMEMLKQVGPSMVFPYLAELVASLTYRTSMPPVDLTNMLSVSASPTPTDAPGGNVASVVPQQA